MAMQAVRAINAARRNEILWLAAWERLMGAETEADAQQAELDVRSLARAGAVLRERAAMLSRRAF